MITYIGRKSFWTVDTYSAEKVFRKRSKILLSILPFLLIALLYKTLTVLESMERGSEIIMTVALGLCVLMGMMILLVLIVSLIEYLRTFE